MRCSKAKKLISQYFDGELSPKEKELFESHTNECPECNRVFEEIRSMHNLFASAEKFKAPYGFSTRVFASINENNAKKFVRLSPIFSRLAEVMVVLLIITFGIISGGFMANRLIPEKTTNISSSFSLDVFDPAPPDSLGGVYLAMVEVNNER